MPVTAHTRKERMMDDCEINVGHCSITVTILDALIPINTPNKPPAILIAIASIRNCSKISIPLAPTDILNPISLVRSVTDTSMIFIIPMPPITSDMPAMTASKTVNNWLVELKALISSAWVRIKKSSGSAGFNL